MIYSYEEPATFNLVMELCTGGDLSYIIRQQYENPARPDPKKRGKAQLLSNRPQRMVSLRWPTVPHLLMALSHSEKTKDVHAAH